MALLVSKRKLVLVLCSLVLLGIVTLGINRLVSSEPTSVDWFVSSPSIELKDVLTSMPGAKNYDCTQTSLRVRNGLSVSNQDVCTVPTAMGLAHYQGSVTQAPGYADAFPIKDAIPGWPVVLPVPNQASAIGMQGSPTGAGVNLALYKQLYNHLTYSPLPTDQHYKLTKLPEEVFRYGNGTQMQLNAATLTFPDNGRHMVIDTIFNGFMTVNLQTLEMKPIAESLPRASGDALLDAATTVDASGRYVAIAYGSPGFWGTPYFKIIDTQSCSGGFNHDHTVKPVFSCRTVNLRPAVEAKMPGLLSINNVRFVNDRTIVFAAAYNENGQRKYGKFTMVAGGQTVTKTQYLGLGDSYISGEGAYDYRTETDTERNRCHQSLASYPYLLASRFQSGKSVACSGAKMHNLREQKGIGAAQVYGGEPIDQELSDARINYIPGFDPQFRFVTNDNPEAITISIGGNDIGFGQVLEKCVHPLKNVKENLDGGHMCYPTYEDRLELVNLINRKLPKLRQLYTDLRNGGTHTRRVYVIGYPQVAKVGGDCGLNVQLNASEVAFAADLVAYLNSVLAQAAREAGVMYVDTQQAFDGRRLCEGDGSQSAMNGFTVGRRTWGGYSFAESFHPNKTGHRLLADAVAAQTDNLTKPMPAPVAQVPYQPVDPNLPLLRNAPFSGRQVQQVQFMEQGEAVVERGSQLDKIINAQDYNIRPDSVYEAQLRSTPVSLGSFRSDANGNLSLAVTIPGDTEPGFHTLHITGTDILGAPINLQETFYVAASGNDADGDGINNEADSCAYAEQSGVDRDADGTDDACDAVIGAAPSLPAEPEGIVWRDDTVLSLEIQTTSGQ